MVWPLQFGSLLKQELNNRDPAVLVTILTTCGDVEGGVAILIPNVDVHAGLVKEQLHHCGVAKERSEVQGLRAVERHGKRRVGPTLQESTDEVNGGLVAFTERHVQGGEFSFGVARVTESIRVHLCSENGTYKVGAAAFTCKMEGRELFRSGTCCVRAKLEKRKGETRLLVRESNEQRTEVLVHFKQAAFHICATGGDEGSSTGHFVALGRFALQHELQGRVLVPFGRTVHVRASGDQGRNRRCPTAQSSMV
mmetsp:Transcript_14215/g.45577  ORF Transcript_14215/g.45577 Transcript_14215/m.45577 type:complete len:252 (+) Transcript_14215:341-1096(+)